MDFGEERRAGEKFEENESEVGKRFFLRSAGGGAEAYM